MTSLPIISADHVWALWAILLLAVAAGFWAERIWIGARFSGAVVTLLLGFALSNAGVIPSTAPTYNTIWTYIVPLSIPLLLLHANMYRLARESGAVLAAFCLGAIGIVLGVLLAFQLVPLGENGWQLAAVMGAGFIGGPAGFSASAGSVGLTQNSVMHAGMAANNVVILFYLLLLFALPTFSRFRRNFNEPLRDDRFTQTTAQVAGDARKGARIHIPSFSFMLALSAAICTLSYWLEGRLGWQGTGIVILAVITVTVSLVFRKALSQLQGPQEFGMLFLQLLFAVIGASAHLPTVLKLGPMLLLFAAIILLVHILFLLLVGYFARLSLPELLIASNTGVTGPYTAVAMAATKRWDHLIIPVILCAAVGYASAPHIGTYLGQFLK